ncbi:RDD family protein [Streptomyces sp. ACA25]|uniref:RDD family protein n=1 Tax=Streptomyces sp. ACA25 TaxID=3022596 RepID=UPI0023072712|nr:RDD family protein [Streptomyces sp. ACA25]MDB1087095.1 RDD family protein [Streptomyces sp. ACA25]
MSYPPPPGPDQTPQGQQPYGQQPGYGQQAPYGQPGGPPPFPGQIPGQGYGNYGQGQAAVPHAYAGWGGRFVARIIDFLIFYSVPVILMIIDSAGLEPGEAPGGLYYVGSLIMLAAWVFLGYLVGTTGQTPGRKAVGIQVLKETTGKPLGFGMALVRMLLDVVNSLPCLLGYLWPLWDAKKQTFADKIVGSVVVRKN